MKKIINYLTYLILVLVIGCGGSSSSTGPSASDYLSNGWSSFDAGNYDNSLTNFQSAVNKDDSLIEGYIGIALSHLESESYNESDAETVLENNALANASGDNLKAVCAVLLGIKMKDISNNSYIYDNLYTSILENTDSGWDYFISINNEYNTNISLNYLKGYAINLSIVEVFIRESSYMVDARGALDKVLYYSNFSSLPSNIQTKANNLDSQLENAGY